MLEIWFFFSKRKTDRRKTNQKKKHLMTIASPEQRTGAVGAQTHTWQMI